MDTIPHVERYKNDLKSLEERGIALHNAMQYECAPEEYRKVAKESLGDKAASYLEGLPKFRTTYQAWYSESLALIRQLLPDRLEDFIRHYTRPKNRNEITFSNYTIEDYLQGIQRSRGGEIIVGPNAALSRFEQQRAIVDAVRNRFESTLFDIRQLVQADLFDSELDAARELLKHKFARAAGALGGVVLEKHLAQVCESHQIPVKKTNPSISDFNDALKAAQTIDVPQWRSIQYLADLRNLCDHNKKTEPTYEQVTDLLDGVSKVTKTLS